MPAASSLRTMKDGKAMHKHLYTDYDIQAFIDSELNREEKCRVLRYIKDNDYAYRRYRELLGQKKLLQQWWKNSLLH